MNSQPIEKQVRDSGNLLALNSIFYTIQGEGPFAGCTAVFIRLAGCNLQCPMCDTEYTRRETVPVEEIVSQVRRTIQDCGHTNLIVISGGEPFRQTLKPLVRALLNEGYKVQIETNGTLFEPMFPYALVTIVCSPKTGAINKNLAPFIHAYKYVATAASLKDSPDGLPVHALDHPNSGLLARPVLHDNRNAKIYLQPVDEKDDEANARNLKAVVSSCLKNGFRLCLQIHKLIGVE